MLDISGAFVLVALIALVAVAVATIVIRVWNIVRKAISDV